MSWTSHAYHVAKDFQVLGAASLTFAAAGVAFYGSRWVAQRQSQTTMDALDRQFAEQKRKDAVKEAQMQAALRIALKQACSRLSKDLRDLSRAADGLIKLSDQTATDLLKIDQKGVLWTRFKRLGPYANSQPIFSLPFSEIAQADQATQKLLLEIIDRCSLIDKSKEDLELHLATYNVAIKTYVEAVEIFATQGAEMAVEFRDKIEATGIVEQVDRSETEGKRS